MDFLPLKLADDETVIVSVWVNDDIGMVIRKIEEDNIIEIVVTEGIYAIELSDPSVSKVKLVKVNF